MKHLKFSKDIKIDRDIDNYPYISARQVFGAFKKSNEGVLILNDLIRKQLYICPICKCSLQNKEIEIDHIIPITLIPSWKTYMVTNGNNLMVLCKVCNKQKSSKVNGSYYYLFHREQLCYGPYYSKDIYKEYSKTIKALVKNKYSISEIQQRWNRDMILINRPINQVVEERLIMEVDIIDG